MYTSSKVSMSQLLLTASDWIKALCYKKNKKRVVVCVGVAKATT